MKELKKQLQNPLVDELMLCVGEIEQQKTFFEAIIDCILRVEVLPKIAFELLQNPLF